MRVFSCRLPCPRRCWILYFEPTVHPCDPSVLFSGSSHRIHELSSEYRSSELHLRRSHFCSEEHQDHLRILRPCHVQSSTHEWMWAFVSYLRRKPRINTQRDNSAPIDNIDRFEFSSVQGIIDQLDKVKYTYAASDIQPIARAITTALGNVSWTKRAVSIFSSHYRSTSKFGLCKMMRQLLDTTVDIYCCVFISILLFRKRIVTTRSSSCSQTRTTALLEMILWRWSELPRLLFPNINRV